MKIRLVSEMLDERKRRLLGHILRTESSDPMHEITFDEHSRRLQFEKKRVGRPRNHWTEVTMRNTFEKLHDFEYDPLDENHRILLITAAMERLF